MIIEPTQVTEAGVTFNQLTASVPYWACGYPAATKVITLMSPEDEPQEANSKTQSLLTGFGATESYEEMIEEAIRRKLIFP